jgi:hypothetical protein
MAGQVNEVRAVARIAITKGPDGFEFEVDNPFFIPDQILAAGMRAAADTIEGKTDRSAGLF